jgi:transposase
MNELNEPGSSTSVSSSAAMRACWRQPTGTWKQTAEDPRELALFERPRPVAEMGGRRIPEFTDLGRKVCEHLNAIHAALDHWPQQRPDRIGQHQNQGHHRIAFGFRNPAALIALAMLTLGGLRPALPGR